MQLAALVGVSVPYLAAAQRIDFSQQPHLRAAIEYGSKPLLTAVPRPSKVERLASQLAKLSVEEQRVFARMIGNEALPNFVMVEVV
jgi:hypothetical protein